MIELFPIIRRARRPLNAAPGVADAPAQLRAKCQVLEQDIEALRESNAKLAAECEALKATRLPEHPQRA